MDVKLTSPLPPTAMGHKQLWFSSPVLPRLRLHSLLFRTLPKWLFKLGSSLPSACFHLSTFGNVIWTLVMPKLGLMFSKQRDCPWPTVSNCSNFLAQVNFSTSSSSLWIYFPSPLGPVFLCKAAPFTSLFGNWFKNLLFPFISALPADIQGTINIITTWNTKLNSNLKRTRERRKGKSIIGVSVRAHTTS